MMQMKTEMVKSKIAPIILTTVMISTILFGAFSSFVPVTHVAHAQSRASSTRYSGLVQCDGVPDESKGEIRCNFAALVRQIIYIINWLFYIAIPVAVASFAYAGILYMTGTAASKSKARSIFSSVGIGFLIMAAAWFIVYTILNWLTDPKAGYSALLQ